MPSFTVGDRVEAPDGSVGTVKWTGKNKGKMRGTWVGVEYDDANGDTDGKAGDGTRHFKCKKGYGTYQKPSYFKAYKEKTAKKSKGGKKKDKDKGDSGAKSTKKSAGKSKADKDSGGKKKGGKKGSKKDSKEEKSDDDDDDSDDEPAPKAKGKKGRAAVHTTTIAIQTDPPEEAYSNKELARYVITFEREKNERLQSELDQVKAQMREMTAELAEARSSSTSDDHGTKLLQAENDELKVKLEELELANEFLHVDLESAQLDIADLREKEEIGFDQAFLESLTDVGEKEKAELITTNERLEASLKSIQSSMQSIVNEKEAQIAILKAENAAIPLLEDRVRELLPLERQMEQMKWDMAQNQLAVGQLAECEKLLDTIKERFAVCEGETYDWRSYAQLVDTERLVLEALHEESEALIVDLQLANKEMKQKLAISSQDTKSRDADLRDLQGKYFELKNELDEINRTQLEAAFDTTSIASATAVGGVDDDSKESGDDGVATGQSSKQMANMTFLLSKQIAEAREILATKVRESCWGKSQAARVQLYQAYFPKSLTIDESGIDCLAHLTRSLEKCKQLRDLLEKFYVNPLTSSSKNAELCLQSHVLCSILLEIENYLRAIQHEFLRTPSDEFKAFAAKYVKELVGPLLTGHGSGADGAPVTSPKSIEYGLEALLIAIEQSQLNDFDLGILEAIEKLVKKFVASHVTDSLSPDTMRMTIDQRVNKSQVLKAIADTYYRIQSITINMNRFSGRVHKIMHTDVQTTGKLGGDTVAAILDKAAHSGSEDEADDDIDVAAEVSSLVGSGSPSGDMYATEDSVDAAVARLRVGLIEKLFRLRNSMTDTCLQVLSKTSPIDVGYKPRKRVTYQQIESANRTSVTVGVLSKCLAHTRDALSRVQKLDRALSTIKPDLLLPMERSDAINKLLDGESEAVEDGLANLLDSGYSALRTVLKLMDSVSYQSVSTSDELSELTIDEVRAVDDALRKELVEAYPKKSPADIEKMVNDKRSQAWETAAQKIRDEIDSAYEMREQMTSKDNQIMEIKRQIREFQDVISTKNSAITTLKSQLSRDETQWDGLVDKEKKYKVLREKNETYVKEMTSQSKELRKLQEELDAANTTMESYKAAIAHLQGELGSKRSGRGGRGGRGAAASTTTAVTTGTLTTSSAPSSDSASISITPEMINRAALDTEVMMAIAARAAHTLGADAEMAAENPIALAYITLLHKTVASLHRRLAQISYAKQIPVSGMKGGAMDAASVDFSPLPKRLFTAAAMVSKKEDKELSVTPAPESEKTVEAAAEEDTKTQEASVDEETPDAPDVKKVTLTVDDILAGKTEEDLAAEQAPDSVVSVDDLNVTSKSALALRELSLKLLKIKAVPRVADITSGSAAESARHKHVVRQLDIRSTKHKLASLQAKMADIKAQRLALGVDRAADSVPVTRDTPKTDLARVTFPRAAAAGLPPGTNVDVILDIGEVPRFSQFLGM
jgi:hypothetical protein